MPTFRRCALLAAALTVWGLVGMPDAGAAAAPPGASESVIGIDSRRLVTATTRAPYRSVVWITFAMNGGMFACSGSLISADTIATAGHCVTDGAGHWASDITVYPGRQGDAAPYGSCRGVRTFAATQWKRRADTNYDYAAIKLDCRVGERTGWFELTTDQSVGDRTTIAGYPGDKPIGTMWRSTEVVGALSNTLVFYANDTNHGMSGAGVWRMINRTPTLFAIHTTSVSPGAPAPFGTLNHGTRITTTVRRDLRRWITA